MQSQLELTPTQNRIVRRNPAVRYDAVLKELRTKLSIYNWSKCDIYEICTKHKVSRSLEVSLVRLNIIERQGRKRSYEYRATPLLLKISPDELRAGYRRFRPMRLYRNDRTVCWQETGSAGLRAD